MAQGLSILVLVMQTAKRISLPHFMAVHVPYSASVPSTHVLPPVGSAHFFCKAWVSPLDSLVTPPFPVFFFHIAIFFKPEHDFSGFYSYMLWKN